jgi:histidyl-tRNA synthetase
VIVGGDELAAGVVTIKDLDLGRRLAGEVRDNRAWREDRPGQVSAPRRDWVIAVRRIVEAAG